MKQYCTSVHDRTTGVCVYDIGPFASARTDLSGCAPHEHGWLAHATHLMASGL
jgi:hypothetical protein